MMQHIRESEIRLVQLKSQIELLNLKYPVVTLSRRMGIDNGHVCKVLKGTATCTQRFVDRFYEAFGDDLSHISKSHIDINGAVGSIVNTLQRIKNNIQTIEDLLTAIIEMANVTNNKK